MATTERLTILQTADLHGQLETHDEFYWEDRSPTYRRAGGVARLKTLIESIRAENPHTIVVDNGDCFQGSGWAQRSRGEALVPVVNGLGYDVVMPGNWEVVFGKERLLELAGRYQCRVVCTNMHHAEPGTKPPIPRGNDVVGNHLFEPYAVLECGSVRVGVLAYNDPQLARRQAPDYSKGIAVSTPAQSLRHWVRLLREEEGCALVLVMTHMGIAPQVALASSDAAEGVDYVLGGDTHERIREPIQGTHARVTEPGAFGSFLGRLDVEVGPDGVRELGYELLDVSEDLPEDAGMRATVDSLTAADPALGEVIGETGAVLQRYYVLETPMDNLVTDALFAKAARELRESGGSGGRAAELDGPAAELDIALSNGFRFCPPLVPAADDGSPAADGGSPAADGAPRARAPITRQYLWSMLPENAQVKIGSVTGAQILTWLEKELNNVFSPNPEEVFGGWVVRFAGMRVRFESAAPMGRRVQSVEIGGAPLDPEREYLVAACERDGDPPDTLCRLTGVKNPRLLDFALHDAVEEYLAQHSPVSYDLEGRCTATDLPERELGQGGIEGYEFR